MQKTQRIVEKIAASFNEKYISKHRQCESKTNPALLPILTAIGLDYDLSRLIQSNELAGL